MEDCIFEDDFVCCHNNSADEYQDNLDDMEKYSVKNDDNELGNSLQAKDFNTSESKINLPLAVNERNSNVKEENDNNEGLHISLLKELEDKWSCIETNQKRCKSRDNNNIDSTSRTSFMFNNSMQNWKNAIEESKKKYYRNKVRKNKDEEEFGDFIKEKTKELKSLTIGNIKTNNTLKHPEKIGNKFRMSEYHNKHSMTRENEIIKKNKKERTFLINTTYRIENTNQHKPKLFTFGTSNNNEQIINTVNNNKINIPSLIDKNYSNIKPINQDNQFLLSKIKDIYTELTETSEPSQLYNNKVIPSVCNKSNIKDISLFDLNKNFNNYFNSFSNKKQLPITFYISPRNKSYDKEQTNHQNELNKNTSFSCVSNNRIKNKIIENSKLINNLLPKPNNKRQNHLYKAFYNAKSKQDKPIKMYDKNNFNDTEKTFILINSPTINKIMQQ